MAKRKGFHVIFVILLFLIYFFLASRPIEREIVLVPKWISSLEDSAVLYPAPAADFIPFTLGGHFGYVDSSGQFAINRIIANNIYLGCNMWTEFGAQPANIEIRNLSEEIILNIENPRGYPILLDGRIFIIGSEQNSLSEIGVNGNTLWTYEFGAPLTFIDVRAGLVLTGSLDGVIEVFDTTGTRIFNFEPGGSRYAVILGGALSSDGSRIGIISGLEQQRFLLLERFGHTRGVTPGDIYGDAGGDYRVVFHEFLDNGFRRPVRVLFMDNDRHVVFECSGGIGVFNIRSRRITFIPLDGTILAVSDSGDQGYFFLVTSPNFHIGERNKNLIGVRLPEHRWLPFLRRDNTDAIFLQASFKSDDVFLGRIGQRFIMGGGSKLISFEMEEI